MRKITTSLMIGFLSLFATTTFAQTSLTTIPYSDGNTYSFTSPVAVAGGGVVIIGNDTGWGANTCWDLTSYAGVEMKVTLPAEANGTLAIRFIIAGGTAAQSIVKTVAMEPGTSKVITLDFAADATQSKKLWAIKFPFDISVPTAYNLTIDYINAVTTIATSVNEVKAVDPDALVDVYSLTGALVRKSVKNSEATNGLVPGIYLVGGKKVIVSKQ